MAAKPGVQLLDLAQVAERHGVGTNHDPDELMASAYLFREVVQRTE
ncbi:MULTISPECIES: hypothetical protein [Streptomyces]|nr:MULTISPECIES: hypothetical protein [Streptomyces]MDX3494540.1 hypothetical protein [Streptomyces turgidiscabies]